MADRYGLYAVQMHAMTAQAAGAVVVGGITSQSLPNEVTVNRMATSGGVVGQHAHVTAIQPSFKFDSLHLATLLPVMGWKGMKIDSDGTHPGVTLYAQKFEDGGTRATGSVHRSYTVKKGILVPRTLSVDNRGDASLSCEGFATYDGSNDPLVIADLAALATAGDDDERFTLGPITVGGITLTEIDSLKIDFGLKIVTDNSGSDVYDDCVYITTGTPTITITVKDPTQIKDAGIPLAGMAATQGNTTIYLRKRAEGGTFVASATLEHILINAAGLVYSDAPFDADGSDPGKTTITMEVIDDRTNDPIVIDTSSALPS